MSLTRFNDNTVFNSSFFELFFKGLSIFKSWKSFMSIKFTKLTKNWNLFFDFIFIFFCIDFKILNKRKREWKNEYSNFTEINELAWRNTIKWSTTVWMRWKVFWFSSWWTTETESSSHTKSSNSLYYYLPLFIMIECF